MQLEQRRVGYLIGATGGLGRVVARQFRAAGWSLALSGRADPEIAELVRTVASDASGAPIVGDAFDTSDEAAIRAALDRWEGAVGLPDAVFHLAGKYAGGRAADGWSAADWRDQWEANTLGPALVLSQCMKRLRDSGRPGVLVAIGAVAGIESPAQKLPYGVAKAGLLHLLLGLADEGRAHGIRAHGVVPFVIDSPANRAAMPEADRSRWVSPEQIASLLLGLTDARMGAARHLIVRV